MERPPTKAAADERAPAPEPQEGEYRDGYTFATGSKVEIVSHDPAATARWLREIEIESDREFLLPHFAD